MTTTLKIEGMTCAHCAGRVEKALNALPGIHAKVNLAQKIAVVESEKAIDTSSLINAVTDAGYTVVK